MTFTPAPTPEPVISATYDSSNGTDTAVAVGDTGTIRFFLSNTGNTTRTFWARAWLRNPKDEVIELPPVETKPLAPGDTAAVSWSHTYDIGGWWGAKMEVFDMKASAFTGTLASSGWQQRFVAVTAGPLMGELAQSPFPWPYLPPTFTAGVAATDFEAAATFTTPNGSAWGHGFYFRIEAPAVYHAIFVLRAAQPSWVYVVRTGSDIVTVDGGEVPSFWLEQQTGGENEFVLEAIGDSGVLLVNGRLVATFSLMRHPDRGDVAPFTALFGAEGTTTSFKEFLVRPL